MIQMEDGLSSLKIPLVGTKVNPYELKKDVGVNDDSRNLAIPFPADDRISYSAILSTYKVVYV